MMIEAGVRSEGTTSAGIKERRRISRLASGINISSLHRREK
jgi:hypothetical protein